jgi:transcriptional regulator with XRE-family HTH domain
LHLRLAVATLTTHHLTGTELRSRRLAAGLSRQQLGLLVGVDSGVIGDWEAEERPIDCESAVRQALSTARTRESDRERAYA